MSDDESFFINIFDQTEAEVFLECSCLLFIFILNDDAEFLIGWRSTFRHRLE